MKNNKNSVLYAFSGIYITATTFHHNTTQYHLTNKQVKFIHLKNTTTATTTTTTNTNANATKQTD
jgi:hypothetical protein